MRLSCCVLVMLVMNSVCFAEPDVDRVETLIHQQVDAFRAERELSELAANDNLRQAAEGFAAFMARTGKYGHHADGRTPGERATVAGYRYCIIAENIAYQFRSTGFTTQELADALVQGWKTSPPHRESMLDPDVTETGIGIAQGENGRYYAVQLFGRPRSDMYSFSVANRTNEATTYQLDGEKQPLPAHTVRTHHRCRPAQVQVPGRVEPVRPVNGQTITFTPGGEVQVE